MKEIDFLKAMDWTSPQPLAAVCTLKHDGKIGNALLYCGKVSGREVDKAAKCKIELVKVEGSQIKIPAETKVAFVVSLNQFLEIGDHFWHICDIKKILADESKDALFAWNGYTKIAAAAMK